MEETWAVMTTRQREVCLRSGIVPIDYAGPVAADWPDLLEIVDRRVKPERKKKADALARRRCTPCAIAGTDAK